MSESLITFALSTMLAGLLTALIGEVIDLTYYKLKTRKANKDSK